ncbi:hypothetical protein [Nonomuraea sp. NPDC049480]|uniref:MmyB family transcriptional regulator n=1 Tax=Nonomuraea sp. NPDC049480 TaxID=3364353 RepID=UPI0037A8031F
MAEGRAVQVGDLGDQFLLLLGGERSGGHQNRLAVALLGPPAHTTGPAAGYVYRWFTDPSSRLIYPEDEHPHHSRVMVYDLRAAIGRRGYDAQSMDMVTRLRRASREFSELWETGDVAVRRGDRKRVIHPTLGVVEVHCQNLFSEDGRQRLQFFTAPAGSPAVEQLRLLTVIGVQNFSGSTAEV